MDRLHTNLRTAQRAFGQKTLAEQLELLIPVTDTFAEIHLRGYVHGDIKLRNLVTDENLTALIIIDFGFAQLIGQPLLGMSDLYAAPELLGALAEKSAFAEQDVWSSTQTIVLLLFLSIYNRFREL